MKALSIRQPFAGMIAAGSKTIEVRSWRPPPDIKEFLVCASAVPQRVSHPSPTGPGYVEYLGGVMVCIVRIVGVEPFMRRHARLARCDWDPGQLAWHLSLVAQVEPVPTKGRLGFYDVPDDLIVRR